MRALRFLGSPLGFCLALLAAFHAAVWFWPLPAPDEGKPRPTRAGWPLLQRPRGELRIEVAALRRSTLRLAPVAAARRLSNSLRLAVGQRPAWMFLGLPWRGQPMYFLRNEVPLAEGLTESRREDVTRAVSVVGDLHERLRAEGWQLVLVPVPTKLSLYREHVPWPLHELDPLRDRPLAADRSDEVVDALFAGLRRRGVTAVDLRPRLRALATSNDGPTAVPPAESHWSAAGLEGTAEEIATALRARGLEMGTPMGQQMVPYRFRPDFAEGLDTLRSWPREAAQSAEWREPMARGRKPPLAPADTRSLLAVAGTSYTGQYSWLGDAGLAAALDRRAPHTLVRSFAEAGRGSLQTARSFIEGKTRLLDELVEQGYTGIAPAQKFLVWEFPLRDLGGFRSPIEWQATGPHPLTDGSAPAGPGMTFAQGFYKEERHDSGVSFRWVRARAELVLRTDRPGRHRLTLRPFTPFTSRASRLVVRLDDRIIATLPFARPDFAAAAQVVEMTLQPGSHRLVLESDHPEANFGAADPRTPAFGLTLPAPLEFPAPPRP